MSSTTAKSANETTQPHNIDHIVYAVSELEGGIDAIESLLGVRAVIGGRHPDFGTHNALLSLGPETYLEIIAPCPDLPVPDRGLPFGMKLGQRSRIATWAMRSEAINEVATSATAAGIRIGPIQPGSRRQPDGSLLSWALSDPNAMLFDGALPFLISWGRTPHPASAAPRAGDLMAFQIEHPDPNSLRAALSVLNVAVDVQESKTIRLVARIRTSSGIVNIV